LNVQKDFYFNLSKFYDGNRCCCYILFGQINKEILLFKSAEELLQKLPKIFLQKNIIIEKFFQLLLEDIFWKTQDVSEELIEFRKQLIDQYLS